MPTRNQIPDTRIEKETSNDVSKKNRRGTRLPDDWQPDIAFAVSVGLSQAAAIIEAEKFRDWWPAQPGQKGVKVDWALTWKTWCRNATNDSRRRSQAPPRPREPTLADFFADEARRVQEQEDARIIETSYSHGSADGAVEALPFLATPQRKPH